MSPAIKVKKSWPKTFDNGGLVNLAQLDQLETALGSWGLLFVYQLMYKVCDGYAELADSCKSACIGE